MSDKSLTDIDNNYNKKENNKSLTDVKYNNKKNNLPQKGGKHTSFKKGSESEETSEGTDLDSSNDKSGEYESSENETSESESSSYENESDIYRATETEDGLNRAYNKLNNEMTYISKSQKGCGMSGKEVVKCILVFLFYKYTNKNKN
jgi:hypothetical protein